MMHVGLICDEYPPSPHGGVGSVFRDLAEGVVAAGHRATVVAMAKTERIPRMLEETINGVRILRIPAAPHWWNYRVAAWWERRQARTWMQRVHREHRLDVVECPDYAGWLSQGAICGVPLIVRIHGSNLFYDHELQRKANLFEHRLEIQCLRNASRIASVSHYAGKRTLELAGLNQRPCTVIHNAVDTEVFTPGDPEKIEPGLIVYVNTLNPKKGIEQLIDAANELMPIRPRTRLVVVGADTQHHFGGKYLHGLKERVRPELRERVIFTGRLSRDEIIPWLRIAAVCCNPSHMETFGISPLEAMSVGRPVVFMKNGPGPEVVEDGVSGLLCDSRNSRDVCRCLLRFLDDPAFAETLGRNARERAVRIFDKRTWIERNLRFYEECASGAAATTEPPRTEER